MLLERRQGNTGKMLAVELAHRRLFGEFKPFHRIAAELYDECGSQASVKDRIYQRYEIEISEKTAGLWINRGQGEIRREAEAPVEAVA
jgi:hypothetical protein